MIPRIVVSLIALSLAALFAWTFAAPVPGDNPSSGLLVVANQGDHTALIVDPQTRSQLAKITVGVNGHEVAVSKDGRFAYVPIYGNAGVGKPGTDGASIDVIDLASQKLSTTIDLGKPLRPHQPLFASDGSLYVTTELDNAISKVDPAAKRIVAEIPTGETQSHMMALTPDAQRAYTANVSTGTVSVLDLVIGNLITKISVANHVQRISIAPDGKHVFTHDQDKPRIAVIDTATNRISRWIDVPDTAYGSAVTPDGRWLIAVLPNANRALAIDLNTWQVAKTFDTPNHPGEVLIRPDGAVAFISCMPAGKIAVLDLTSWTMQPNIDLTPGVDGMAWAAK
jgi:DNA-binding beta-propeller fold protein YncE